MVKQLLVGVLLVAAARPASAGTRAQSRTIYLNRAGVTVTPGPTDSRANRTSLAASAVAIPPWNASSQLWADTVSCLRDVFAPFDIRVTDTDPGDLPHIETVFGGSPTLLGQPAGIPGVSPLRIDCGVIESSMVFVFTDAIPQNAEVACRVAAQEIGHSYGLDHELLAADPMSYLSFSGRRTFQNTDASCGETTARPCGQPGYPSCRATQNSYALLLERIGAAGTGDIDPPAIMITTPIDGALVASGFPVVAQISDDVRVAHVSLEIDGIAVATLDAPPWQFTAPADLVAGPHTVELVASDGTNTSTSSRDIEIAPDAQATSNTPTPFGCSATGSNSLGGVLLALGAVLARKRRR